MLTPNILLKCLDYRILNKDKLESKLLQFYSKPVVKPVNSMSFTFGSCFV